MQGNTVYEGKVLILLATHNGERYLNQQLDSLANQSYKNWDLLIRDDASSDKTREIIVKWMARFGNNKIRFEQAPDAFPLGALANFSALCTLALDSDAQYYCFCDQDDIWHQHKLTTMVSCLARMEAQHGDNSPMLAHSDLRVVDSSGELISPSFIQFQGLPDPRAHPLQKLLIQNNVTGCASLFNRSLLEFATPVPTEIAIHDWWIALCAESVGHIEFIEEALVDYRQHQKNLVGAKSKSITKNPFHRYFYKILYSFPGHLEKSLLQDQLLLDRLRTRSVEIDYEKLDRLIEYSGLQTRNYANRSKILNRTLNTKREIPVFIYLMIVALFYPRKHSGN